VKYSPKQSEVKIICRNISPHPLLASTKPNPEFLEILVIDQGFGMNEEQVKNAFEKYQTIQNPNSGTVDSFGLGLPIAKHLVEMQNGIIEVKSELNVGTEIKLRFPYLM
jgi:signal transduction histidine kinase